MRHPSKGPSSSREGIRAPCREFGGALSHFKESLSAPDPECLNNKILVPMVRKIYQPVFRVSPSVKYVVMRQYGVFECAVSSHETYLEALAQIIALRRTYGDSRQYRMSIMP